MTRVRAARRCGSRLNNQFESASGMPQIGRLFGASPRNTLSGSHESGSAEIAVSTKSGSIIAKSAAFSVRLNHQVHSVTGVPYLGARAGQEGAICPYQFRE